MGYDWTSGNSRTIQLLPPLEMDQWYALAIIILWRDVLTVTIDDGRCIIDITSEPGDGGMATPAQLRDAATAVVEECVADGKGSGGMIHGIGECVCQVLGFY